jgi:hypothetical protein
MKLSILLRCMIHTGRLLPIVFEGQQLHTVVLLFQMQRPTVKEEAAQIKSC